LDTFPRQIQAKVDSGADKASRYFLGFTATPSSRSSLQAAPASSKPLTIWISLLTISLCRCFKLLCISKLTG